MNSAITTTLDPAALKPGAAVRLLPDGLFRANDGRPVGIANWKMDAAIAAKLIEALRARAEALVIDYEHQTLTKEKNGQPAPAAGWFRELEYRAGEGLFMTGIGWTLRARTMIESGEYRYLSPVFGFDPVSGAVTSLHGAALTNTPALTGLTDLAAASAMKPAPPPPLQAGITAEDRAKLNHFFGDLFDKDAAIGMTSPQSPEAPKVDMSQVSAEDLAKFKHAFGDLPGFNSFIR